MDLKIYIAKTRKWRPPKNAVEYFKVLYCNRRKLGSTVSEEVTDAWKSLSHEEQKVFIDKFKKWQARNDKKITSILKHTEPFLKKKTTIENESVQHDTNTTKVNNYDSQPKSTILSANSNGAISNTNLEVSKPEDLNIEFFMNDYDDDQSESTLKLVYDDTSHACSEVPKQHYTASVVNTNIDELEEQMNDKQTDMNSALPEPTLTAVTPKELFEIIKGSSTRPDLSNVEWKEMPTKEKRTYYKAARKMRRDYLIKYEQYLESLPSPELFKHYIKFKSEN